MARLWLGFLRPLALIIGTIGLAILAIDFLSAFLFGNENSPGYPEPKWLVLAGQAVAGLVGGLLLICGIGLEKLVTGKLTISAEGVRLTRLAGAMSIAWYELSKVEATQDLRWIRLTGLGGQLTWHMSGFTLNVAPPTVDKAKGDAVRDTREVADERSDRRVAPVAPLCFDPLTTDPYNPP